MWYNVSKEVHMEKEKFCLGDKCIIVEIGQGGFHFEARKNFLGKKAEFAGYCSGVEENEEGFISCELVLLEDICINETSKEYMTSGFKFYFPCVKLAKATG